MIAHPPTPTLDKERAIWATGAQWLAGIDEVGRGALAGPVVAAAVVVPPHATLAGVWAEVRDSKLLSPDSRQMLECEVRWEAVAWAIGSASAAEVDRLGVAEATRRAMTDAVHGLSVSVQHLLIDWVQLPHLPTPQTAWAKADRDSVSVAAASILAKVWRDRLLVELDATYPVYGFRRHKGYGTLAHRSALSQYGPCPEHRRSFAPVAQCRSLFDTDIQSTQPRPERDGSMP